MSQAEGKITLLMPLPKYYNPDKKGERQPIEDEKFDLTAREVTEHFQGGAVVHPFYGEAIGFWWNRGFVGNDVLLILEADIPDDVESREWVKSYAKNILLKRFRQKAVYWKFVGPVETVLVTAEEDKSPEGEESMG